MTDTKHINLYDLLEVEPGATEDEIRRAHKRLTQLFDSNGVVMYGLYCEADAKRLQAKFRDAYETLMDPEKRRLYDRNLYPHGHPCLRRADERVVAQAPRKIEPPSDPLAALGLPADVQMTGDVLRRIREICGVSPQEILTRTKISIFTLKCLEEDCYANLPAPVYLKGFLNQIAKLLKLDSQRVISDYMGAYEQWRKANGHI